MNLLCLLWAVLQAFQLKSAPTTLARRRNGCAAGLGLGGWEVFSGKWQPQHIKWDSIECIVSSLCVRMAPVRHSKPSPSLVVMRHERAKLREIARSQNMTWIGQNSFRKAL